jgi:acetyl-CoA acyltransferase
MSTQPNAYVAGIGLTRLGKFPERSVKDLVREAVHAALDDAGVTLADIECGWLANSRQGGNGALDGSRIIAGPRGNGAGRV